MSDTPTAPDSADPLLADMRNLAGLPPDQRRHELAIFVADWFSKGTDNDTIASYLAAAGLTPDESQALVADVYEHQKARVTHKQLSNARFGGLFAILGALIFCTGILSNLSLPRLIGAMLFVYGITRLMSRPTTPPPLTPLTKSSESDSDRK